ncbi:MAG TPA: DNA polymerase III [Magnetospirillum sp.]|jgi:hypothetical protein|nr:DNA polymerase III [Magnetospirillum sp.]
MADAIPPAPPTVTLAASGGGGPVVVSVVSDDAAAVLKMLDGALLEGEAFARAAKGVIDVATPDGTLQLKAAPGVLLPPIPAGATLLFQKQDGLLTLVAVNGRPLGGTPLPGGTTMAGLLSLNAPATQAASPQVQNPVAAMTQPPAAPQAPLGLPATLLRPNQPGEPPMPGATGGLPADLPAGTRLTVRIAEIELPQAQPQTQPQALTATPPTPSPAPQAAAGQAQMAPNGGITPAPQAPTLSTQPAPAGLALPDPGIAPLPRIPGTVVAHPPGGNAVVQTPIGTLSVPTHADLPAGTLMMLEVVAEPELPLPSPAPATSATPGLNAQGWPALDEALEVLADADQPQALEQLLRSIPQADTRLAATLAAFTGTARTPEGRRLLPETSLRGIEKAGRKELAARLKGDLEALDADAGRPVVGGDWRAYTVPFLNGGAIEAIRLFVRKANGDEGGNNAKGGGKGSKDERFILDFNLTRLGRLQLDGLVRREDKLFDLIIRSDQAFSPEMRRDILGIFSDAAELVGTKGTVSFQSGGRWMEFPPDPPVPTRIEA